MAWVLLVGSVVGWPLSQLTFAKHEPPTVLGLSWLALFLNAVNILMTVGVRNIQEKDTAQ
jgi:hypothetical protein